MSRRDAFLAGIIALGGLGAAILIGTARLVRGHVTSDAAPAEDAAREIDRAAARFAGQRPLREIRDGGAPIKAPAPTIIGDPTRFLRARLWDVRSQRLVRVDLPIAVLRVVKRDGFRYLGELTPLQTDTEFERDRIDLPLAEIVGHGPLLVVSHAHASGARIVAWVD